MTPPRFVNEADTDQQARYTAAVAKALLGYKKLAQLASIRQNYKGTGSQRARRQLWIRLVTGGAIDIWLEADSYTLGGVTATRIPGRWGYEGRAPEAIAGQIAAQLRTLSPGGDTPAPGTVGV